MSRTVAELPAGVRVSDCISLGVIAEKVPPDRVHQVLEGEGKQSQRQRQLPAHVVVYYVMALALYMGVSYGEVLRCLVAGLEWLGLPVRRIRQTGPSGISQARSRLGWAPLRRLYCELVAPVATERTRGAWYRQWRLVSLDGTTLDVADEQGNAEAFGRPGASRGASSFPQLRWVALVECGTHVLFGAAEGPYGVGETTLARQVLPYLKPGMLCMADRNYFGYAFWREAVGTKADLLWRGKADLILPPQQLLPDGSYLSQVYPSPKHRSRDEEGLRVRVIEYTLEGVEGAEPVYRLLTTLLDPQAAPAEELAALYHERWEIETAFDEFKIHLRGARIVLRSKTPDLVRQEFYGLLLAHFAVRALMHEAALKADLDPDQLSFTHTVRIVRRKILTAGSFPPSGPAAAP